MTIVQPISFSLQCFYLLIHLTALACGLWMVHDPVFTLAMFLLAPASMLLSRLPMKVFPGVLRQAVQLLYGFAAVFWLQKYLPVRAVGSLLVEFGCIVFPSLYLLRSRREHNILLFGLMGIVFYGSLSPNRAVFLPSLTAVLLMVVLLLYCTRISFLGLQSERGQQVVPAERAYHVHLGYRMMHFCCSMLLACLLISQFSLTRRIRTWGIIPADWNVQQELKFPRVWSEWTAPLQKFLPGREGEKSHDSTQIQNTEFQEDRRARNIVRGEGMSSGREGAGAAMSNQLIFRAVVPAKMYWMVQAYDTYDGNEWTRSETMTMGKGGLDRFIPREFYLLQQNIVMENPLSRMLPCVFNPVKLSWADDFSAGLSADPLASAFSPGVIRRKDHIVYELINQTLPPVPWRYTVESRIPSPDLKQTSLEDTGRTRGWNYLQIPRTKISGRMRQLARSLTAGTEDRMEKAMILQNYLKKHCSYTLTPGKIPRDAEVCDYFLFESRAGYCQHFAQALTVLARLSGLPARLAVGFSPGNYNFLANCFEVYEYHGHAWTQIFIEPYGWLTFDGTPPGAIPDMAGPKFLQKLLDPFGERKDSRPPEITFRPAGEAINPEVELMGGSEPPAGEAMTLNDMQQKAMEIYEKIYEEAARKNPDKVPTLGEMVKAGSLFLLAGCRRALDEIRRAGLRWKNRWKDFLLTQWQKLDRWARSLTFWNLGCMLAEVVLLYEGWNRRRQIARLTRKLWRKWRMHCLWRKIQRGCYQGEKLASVCQNLIFRWLENAGIRRLPAQDVFEYGEHLRQRRPELWKDYLMVAEQAARCWYGSGTVTREQGRRIVSAAARLYEQLKH